MKKQTISRHQAAIEKRERRGSFQLAQWPEVDDKLVVDLVRQHPEHFTYPNGSTMNIVDAREACRLIIQSDEVWLSDTYQVAIREVEASIEGWPRLVHLSIRRLDREPIRDWREMQRIKNELVGPENEGVELYPAESRLVDAANQFHIYVFKDPQARWPFGFNERMVDDQTCGNSKQRPFDKG